ncbi:Transthyretin-like family protein [Ancylostoma caninum]|uniref:Transthyretin-like family protein n=1 Tax=Ancylostoma caninum TaxID=29170 RepID=A0A368FIN3_ANCCA|nr:Transthyretin-like family protein [Ancylostoma caninum]
MRQILLLLAIVVCPCLALRQQSVGITGRLMCGDKPAAGVKVKLYDEDDGLDRDDLLDQGFTDARGEFTLKGSERETTNIDPVFKVYHDCDDGIKPGQRKVKFHIPNQYIYSGGLPRRLFNIGVLNLETIFPDEERDLI